MHAIWESLGTHEASLFGEAVRARIRRLFDHKRQPFNLLESEPRLGPTLNKPDRRTCASLSSVDAFIGPGAQEHQVVGLDTASGDNSCQDVVRDWQWFKGGFNVGNSLRGSQGHGGRQT
jgi:hypothetical protein